MSGRMDEIVREAFADPGLDFLSIGRTPRGDFCASVKRAFRGYGVHYGPDPGSALEKALAAPPTPAASAFATARAAAAGREPPSGAPSDPTAHDAAGLFD